MSHLTRSVTCKGTAGAKNDGLVEEPVQTCFHLASVINENITVTLFSETAIYGANAFTVVILGA